MAIPGVISRWHLYVENFQASALDFYAAVEVGLARREAPDCAVGRILRKEGGFASAERQYLRVQRRKVAFDVCASPYGSGYFFSWWLHRLPPSHPLLALAALFLGLPFLSLIIWAVFGKGCVGAAGAMVAVPAVLFLLGWAVSQGMIADDEDVLAIPVVGWLYARVFNPVTLYRLDTELMFQEAVRAAVNEEIARLRDGQGLQSLSDEEWRPHLQNLGR